MEMKWVKGTNLFPEDCKHVISAFVHRFTGSHKPQWATGKKPDGSAYKIQFKDDQDWLENTRFPVKKDGRLDRRVRYCESDPTWPEGHSYSGD